MSQIFVWNICATEMGISEENVVTLIRKSKDFRLLSSNKNSVNSGISYIFIDLLEFLSKLMLLNNENYDRIKLIVCGILFFSFRSYLSVINGELILNVYSAEYGCIKRTLSALDADLFQQFHIVFRWNPGIYRHCLTQYRNDFFFSQAHECSVIVHNMELDKFKEIQIQFNTIILKEGKAFMNNFSVFLEKDNRNNGDWSIVCSVYNLEELMFSNLRIECMDTNSNSFVSVELNKVDEGQNNFFETNLLPIQVKLMPRFIVVCDVKLNQDEEEGMVVGVLIEKKNVGKHKNINSSHLFTNQNNEYIYSQLFRQSERPLSLSTWHLAQLAMRGGM